jgi:hypothetical protein
MLKSVVKSFFILTFALIWTISDAVGSQPLAKLLGFSDSLVVPSYSHRRIESKENSACYIDVTKLGRMTTVKFGNGEIHSIVLNEINQVERVILNGKTYSVKYGAEIRRDGFTRPGVAVTVESEASNSADLLHEFVIQPSIKNAPTKKSMRKHQKMQRTVNARIQNKMCPLNGVKTVGFIKVDSDGDGDGTPDYADEDFYGDYLDADSNPDLGGDGCVPFRTGCFSCDPQTCADQNEDRKGDNDALCILAGAAGLALGPVTAVAIGVVCNRVANSAFVQMRDECRSPTNGRCQ